MENVVAFFSQAKPAQSPSMRQNRRRRRYRRHRRRGSPSRASPRRRRPALWWCALLRRRAAVLRVGRPTRKAPIEKLPGAEISHRRWMTRKSGSFDGNPEKIPQRRPFSVRRIAPTAPPSALRQGRRSNQQARIGAAPRQGIRKTSSGWPGRNRPAPAASRQRPRAVVAQVRWSPKFWAALIAFGKPGLHPPTGETHVSATTSSRSTVAPWAKSCLSTWPGQEIRENT